MRNPLRAAALLASVIFLTSCGATAPDGEDPVSAGNDAAPASALADERFDHLDLSLAFESTSVRQGKTLRSRLLVENGSSGEVVDPSCALAEGRHALVPVDEPDSELWLRPTTDCAGEFSMEPGFRKEYDGPDFPAHDKYGKSLPPGDYLAVLQIQGLSQRLEYPVTIVEGRGPAAPEPGSERTQGAWCAPSIGGDHAHDEGGPAFELLPEAGEVPEAISAYVCTYGAFLDADEYEPGVMKLWDGPAVVQPAQMQDLNRLLGELVPADPERACTAEGGPTHLIHVRTDSGSMGLQVQDHGCGDAYFVSHPRVGAGSVGNPVEGAGPALRFSQGARELLELLGGEQGRPSR